MHDSSYQGKTKQRMFAASMALAMMLNVSGADAFAVGWQTNGSFSAKKQISAMTYASEAAVTTTAAPKATTTTTIAKTTVTTVKTTAPVSTTAAKSVTTAATTKPAVTTKATTAVTTVPTSTSNVTTTTTTAPTIEDEKLGFSYKQVDDGIQIVKYLGGKSEIEIPESINGVPVVEITDYAFRSERKRRHPHFPVFQISGPCPAVFLSLSDDLHREGSQRRFAR